MISSAFFFNEHEYIFQRQQNCTACGASAFCSLWKLQVGEGGGEVHLCLGFSARISLLCRRLKFSIFLIQPVSKLRARFSLFHLLQL